jgi:hypothetical protein
MAFLIDNALLRFPRIGYSLCDVEPLRELRERCDGERLPAPAAGM